MIRSLTKSPVLMLIYPFVKRDNPHDKPANAIITPLNDELGWDRVKNIFSTEGDGIFTKELQSIFNITLSGFAIGLGLGGVGATKNTVDTFITNNEATRFISQFDAKRELRNLIMVNFIKKGVRLGAKLGTFCFIFSLVTTCTTTYRGKLAIENYMLGGSVTGLLFKMNLGLRAMLVGTGLGCVLGGLCGSASLLILKLSGLELDEILIAHKQWAESKNKEKIREKIKERMDSELPEIKKIYEENRTLWNIHQTENVENFKEE